MSLVKKLLELPENSKLRKQGEAFLSGKPLPKKLSIKKWDKVKLKDGREGKIMRYYSNIKIGVQFPNTDFIMEIVTKDDIEEVLS